ncbi:hypothetical protein RZS08_17390, partial [Arthrospira platensis SPKY1]|nr:hypothetical protein [Arthrospira platensis SPKY1]
LKKRGVSLNLGTGKNKAVTHAPRHLLVSELSSIDKELTTVQKTIGHKSIKSTQHYEKTGK